MEAPSVLIGSYNNLEAFPPNAMLITNVIRIDSVADQTITDDSPIYNPVSLSVSV
jgi:hypothetical protein